MMKNEPICTQHKKIFTHYLDWYTNYTAIKVKKGTIVEANSSLIFRPAVRKKLILNTESLREGPASRPQFTLL